MTWNRAEMWRIGVLQDQMPEVFTWTERRPTLISLGSVTLPFEETGAEAASAKFACPCYSDVGGDWWLQYRGTRGRFGGVEEYYKDKVFVHHAHKTRGQPSLWAALMPGEVWNAPNSSIYVHFCASRTDAVAHVS